MSLAAAHSVSTHRPKPVVLLRAGAGTNKVKGYGGDLFAFACVARCPSAACLDTRPDCTSVPVGGGTGSVLYLTAGGGTAGTVSVVEWCCLFLLANGNLFVFAGGLQSLRVRRRSLLAANRTPG